MASKSKLMAIIGDEDTCTGFLLGGVGEQNKKGQVNFKVCGKETSPDEIAVSLKEFLNRKDIAIILITQTYAELVRDLIDAHTEIIPAILEIPSKEHPYDASKDSLLKRAKGLFGGERITNEAKRADSDRTLNISG